MYRKLLVSLGILLTLIFSFSVCFANNNIGQDAIDGVRNFVGGAENAMEDAARGVSNTSRDVTGDLENGANNVGNTMMNNGDNNHTTKDTNNNTGTDANTNNNNNNNTGNYMATRTATDINDDTTLMGMNATTWTWLIIGIAAIAIVALVWYYSMQLRSTNYDNRD